MSRYTSAVTLVATFLASGLIGCTEDPQAKGVRDARIEFTQHIESLDRASRGLSDQPADADDAPGPDVVRREKLTELQPRLEAMLTKGPTAQQVYSARLLANVHLTLARDEAREAVTHWSTLSGATSRFASMLRQAEYHRAMVARHTVDETQLANQLRTRLEAERGKLSRIQEQRTALQAEVQRYERTIEELTQQRNKASEDAVKFKDEAFTLVVDRTSKEADGVARQKHELEVKAIEAQRAADEASNRMTAARVHIDTLRKHLALVDQEIALINQGIRGGEGEDRETLPGIEGQLRAIEQRQADNGRARQAAQRALDGVAADIEKAFLELNQSFQESVEGRFEAIDEQLTKAAAILEQAEAKARGEHQQDVRLERAALLLEQGRLRAEHLATRKGYAEIIALLVNRGRVLQLDQLGQYTRRLENIAESQQQLIDDASSVLSAATALTDTITAPQAESPAAKLLDSVRRQLDAVSSRLDATLLD